MEEDLSLDAMHERCEGRTDAEWQYLIDALEKYDPGDKRAHEIAGKFVDKSD